MTSNVHLPTLAALMALCLIGTNGVKGSDPTLAAKMDSIPAKKLVLPEPAEALNTALEAEFARTVISPYDDGIKILRIRYRDALEEAMKKAANRANLDESLSLKNEIAVIDAGVDVPAKDESGIDPNVISMRTIWRREVAKLEMDKEARRKVLVAGYDAKFREIEEALTKALRLDDAKSVRDRREVVAKTVALTFVSNLIPAQPAIANQGYTNSLGMKFVPVLGTSVLFCIHETRKRDYAAFAKQTKQMSKSWEKPEWQGMRISSDDHPVVGVSWNDAQAFCVWLSDKEKKVYRLPTDREWSIAVGIGDMENPNSPPHLLTDQLPDQFPWGNAWPPPTGAGNLPDESLRRKDSNALFIEKHDDEYASIAPVMSFAANKFGLFDLEGNVAEFCSDYMYPRSFEKDARPQYQEMATYRIARGGVWLDASPGDPDLKKRLRSSNRRRVGPAATLYNTLGLRCVLER